jgi:hypothetical protein
MIQFDRLKHQPRVLTHLTGLTLPAFEELLPAFQLALQQAQQQRESQRPAPRQRKPGAGRKPVLAEAPQQLLFILLYFRVYPTQETLAFLFGFSQGQASYWIHQLAPCLQQALGEKQELPARQPCSLLQVLSDCPELEFLIDGTERPIRRPQDKDRQKENYSGKRKRHTRKNILVTEKRTAKVKGLGQTQPGSRHDKKAADEERFDYPAGSVLWKDTGFQGYEPPGVQTRQPKKKPRKQPLSEEDKASNREISQERIGVEHSIGGVKIFRIVQDVLRNIKAGFDDLVMEIACGLHNFRLTMKGIR